MAEVSQIKPVHCLLISLLFLVDHIKSFLIRLCSSTEILQHMLMISRFTIRKIVKSVGIPVSIQHLVYCRVCGAKPLLSSGNTVPCQVRGCECVGQVWVRLGLDQVRSGLGQVRLGWVRFGLGYCLIIHKNSPKISMRSCPKNFNYNF